MGFKEKMEQIEYCFTIVKRIKVTEKQRQELYNLIMGLSKNTQLQKDRFIMYYGLNPKESKDYKLIEIAKLYNRTDATVRGSILAVKRRLARLPSEQTEIFQKIIEEYENSLINE